MIIEPKVRGFICTTAHPIGCAQHVQNQINYVKNNPKIVGAKKVLVIGASTGYGLSSRIATAYGNGAATIGVFFEKPAEGARTATAGWYNTAAFENAAHKDGLYAKSINGDAFSDEIKQKTIELIKQDLEKVDLVVYSLASPRRTHPKTGENFASVLRPIGKTYSEKSINPMTGEIKEVSIEPAADGDIENTIRVMGGEDWEMWMDALQNAGVLSENAITVAYSYIGPILTYPIYREGTIGKAKEHLEKTAAIITDKLQKIGGRAFVSVNKAVVTQSSSAIPVVPLYISLLFRIMKEKKLHEDCIEQAYRLFSENLYANHEIKTDKKGLIRIDDWEMREDVQSEVSKLWEKVNSENITDYSDLAGYRNDFYKLFGFALPDVDYKAEVEIKIDIPSIK
ncbi:enoyl-ACP reductase FabV [Fluviispira multicolorata]|uniref:Enoyl-[acyl-carrier-protein] reductase [NADH] n=1 Tax=Fluviispira multicolorata TaxID=2654512 RepID=A0A833JG14_9BACT|nr:enoyl-ACP reductase FabV [Fluviispira multicolorata]KAB8033693.1 enoyl-[acyl-carrier-protein] reductase FabV [Fluviispira multicolorata]